MILENLWETQDNSGYFESFLNSGWLRAVLIFYKNLIKVLRFLKTSGQVFIDLEWDLVDAVSIFCYLYIPSFIQEHDFYRFWNAYLKIW